MASSDDSSSLASGPGIEPAPHDQIYGPLTIERHVKTDGRRLILFARLQESDAEAISGASQAVGALPAVEARQASEDPQG